jgi:hypothetical protein
MREIKGPAIFLAQFLSDQAPFNSLKSITRSFIRDHIIRVTEHAFDDSAGAAGVGGRGQGSQPPHPRVA